MEYIYLHGWASSPHSQKAQYFKQHFAQLGIPLCIPDLNQADFYNLTLTRQLKQVAALLGVQPVTLVGSSLGGLTALWLAQQHSQIERLVLMAPALNFVQQCEQIIGEPYFSQWRDSGELNVYHYAWQRQVLISYAFVADMLRYADADLQRAVPTLILHGKYDEVIPIDSSRAFATQRQWIQLVELDSNHSLANVHHSLWTATQQFLQL